MTVRTYTSSSRGWEPWCSERCAAPVSLRYPVTREMRSSTFAWARLQWDLLLVAHKYRLHTIYHYIFLTLLHRHILIRPSHQHVLPDTEPHQPRVVPEELLQSCAEPLRRRADTVCNEQDGEEGRDEDHPYFACGVGGCGEGDEVLFVLILAVAWRRDTKSTGVP